ncbi:MAG: hypothetical protein ABI873_13035 [Marmoricola sp.]
MTRNTKVLAGASLALALGVAGQLGLYHHQAPSSTTVHASWIFKPTSIRQLQARANSIALVKVLSTQAGPDIVTRQPGEPSGEDRIPTRRVNVEVLKSYKGSGVGQRLTLFQTGGTVKSPPPPAQGTKGQEVPDSKVQQVILSGDPLYRAGEQYLVMLEAGPQGTLRTVSPEGRYRYDARSGALTPMVKNTVTTRVSSTSLSAMAPVLRGQVS